MFLLSLVGPDGKILGSSDMTNSQIFSRSSELNSVIK